MIFALGLLVFAQFTTTIMETDLLKRKEVKVNGSTKKGKDLTAQF